MDERAHRFLGRTGLRVSVLCLGTMTFGREANEEQSRAILDAYTGAGGNFIDTADVYAGTESESIIGRWLKEQKRDDLVIATKVRFPSGEGPNDVGVSRKHILSSIDASLKRLQTDYVDLYQVHAWDAVTPLEETLSTLDGLVKAGKVRYVGVSNFTGWQLQKALDMSQAHGWEPFVSLQPLYNLLDRYTEWELVPVCENEGLGIIPWSPLRGGWLTGKYRRGHGTGAGRHAHGRGRRQPVAAVQRGAHVGHHRRTAGRGRGGGQVTGAGGAELAVAAAGRDCTDHRRAHDRAVGGQPGRGGLDAGRRTDGAAERGERGGAAVSV